MGGLLPSCTTENKQDCGFKGSGETAPPPLAKVKWANNLESIDLDRYPQLRFVEIQSAWGRFLEYQSGREMSLDATEKNSTRATFFPRVALPRASSIQLQWPLQWTGLRSVSTMMVDWAQCFPHLSRNHWNFSIYKKKKWKQVWQP